jgi:NADPH-dependent 2,4-dienoyl-CoA reductase/sulfur reductase-like enzyme
VREHLTADVAVVGLGPAGVAAAVRAAEAGARVVVLDDGLQAGGQIWRHRTDARRALPKMARTWLDRLSRLPPSACQLLLGAAVVDAAGPGRIAASRDGSLLTIEARALVMATGARERFLPFPGWTLPGVLGLGGAQTLAKTGASFAGRRVVVAGSGPLLLPVAATLCRGGAEVAMVAEQAPARRVLGFAAGLVTRPAKIAEALRYRWSSAAAPYRLGVWVVAARGRERLEAVTVTDGRRRWEERCDVLACAFGLVPNLELPRLLGCRIEQGGVVVDDAQRTSRADVLAAGEVCGVGGADLALVEGEIAGLSAVGQGAAAAALVPRRARLRVFAQRLERAFALRDELRRLAEAQTVVCRCEDVEFGRLRPEWSPRQAKLYTRLGMGPCQGRVCGASCEFLFGWPADTVRPPLFPVPLDSLKEAEA